MVLKEGTAGLPTRAARATLERANQISGDPPPVEAASLCLHAFAINVTFKDEGVKRMDRRPAANGVPLLACPTFEAGIEPAGSGRVVAA
jgi:hypothetical protein